MKLIPDRRALWAKYSTQALPVARPSHLYSVKRRIDWQRIVQLAAAIFLIATLLFMLFLIALDFLAKPCTATNPRGTVYIVNHQWVDTQWTCGATN